MEAMMVDTDTLLKGYAFHAGQTVAITRMLERGSIDVRAALALFKAAAADLDRVRDDVFSRTAKETR
jgi:DNA-binding FrmR family transcriptional regulator